MSAYRADIIEILKASDRDENPLAVEAYMRDEHGTLDHLSRAQFLLAALAAADLVAADPALGGTLAACMGLSS